MFFASAKKTNESPVGSNAAATPSSPTKTQDATCVSSGILSILLFNPSLVCKEVASPKESDEAVHLHTQAISASAAAAAAAEADDAGFECLSQEQKEQEAKIVYCYPPSLEPEERRSQAGLLEGLLMFSKPFSPGGLPLRSISTNKYLIVLLQVEANYWLAMTFASEALARLQPSDSFCKNREFSQLDEDTLETILLGVLRSFYATFRLLHGRFAVYEEGGRRDELKDILNDFCPAFVETIDCSKLSVFHAIAGYHFGPVDRLPYLSVPSLVALLQQSFPCINHAALLVNGCLVYHSINTPIHAQHLGAPCSGLDFENDALVALYNYLVSSEGAAAVDLNKLLKPPYGRVPTAAARPGGGCSSFGRAITEQEPLSFIFGPVGQFAFLPSVHLADDSTGNLLAIVHEQLLLVLILSEADERVLDVSFLQNIRSAAVDGPCGLRELNSVLSVEFKKIMKQEDTYRFVYFNHANRAIRISNRPCVLNSPSPPYFKNFCLSHQEVQKLGHMHCKYLGLADFSFPTQGDDPAAAADCAGGVTESETGISADEVQASKLESGKAAKKSRSRSCVDFSSVRVVAVKEAQTGWLVGKRTCDREHVLALDDPKTTFTKAMEDANRFSSLHFSNIFV